MERDLLQAVVSGDFWQKVLCAEKERKKQYRKRKGKKKREKKKIGEGAEEQESVRRLQ